MTCTHTTVKCTCCGLEGSPAQILAKRPRGERSPEAKEQSRQAGAKGVLARKGKKGGKKEDWQ